MIKKSLALLLVLVVLTAASFAFAAAEAPLTAADVAGTYDVQVNTFTGEDAPLSNPAVVIFLDSGVWMIMCSMTVGPDTFEYPCSFNAWSIDAENNVIPQFGTPFQCRVLSPGVMWCWVPGRYKDVIAIRRAPAVEAPVQ